MQEPKYYRAKLQFPDSENSKNQVKAGLYAQSSHYLVEVEDCLVQDNEAAHENVGKHDRTEVTVDGYPINTQN